MFTISKEIHFCYGHRLMHHPGKCRHIHGHSVKAAITVAAEELDEQSMVCDFAEIEEVARGYINSNFDHNLLLHKDDPLVSLLEQAEEKFLALDQHPTAEVLAKLLYEYMQQQGLKVSDVTLWETANAYACYKEQSVA